MRKTIITLVCGALLSISAFAADVTGQWKAEMKTRNGDSREVMFNLKAAGSTLTGTMSGAQGREMEISNGKIDGDNISFDTTMQTPDGQSRTISYTGTLSGDELKLKRAGGGGGGGNGGAGGGGGNGGGGNGGGRGGMGGGEMVAKRVKVS